MPSVAKKILEQLFYALSIIGMLLVCFQYFFGNSFAIAQHSLELEKHDAEIANIQKVMLERIEQRNKEFEEIRIRLTHIEDALGVKRE